MNIHLRLLCPDYFLSFPARTLPANHTDFVDVARIARISRSAIDHDGPATIGSEKPGKRSLRYYPVLLCADLNLFVALMSLNVPAITRRGDPDWGRHRLGA